MFCGLLGAVPVALKLCAALCSWGDSCFSLKALLRSHLLCETFPEPLLTFVNNARVHWGTRVCVRTRTHTHTQVYTCTHSQTQ